MYIPTDHEKMKVASRDPASTKSKSLAHRAFDSTAGFGLIGSAGAITSLGGMSLAAKVMNANKKSTAKAAANLASKKAIKR